MMADSLGVWRSEVLTGGAPVVQFVHDPEPREDFEVLAWLVVDGVPQAVVGPVDGGRLRSVPVTELMTLPEEVTVMA